VSNVDRVWRQAIDVNGDGRIDVIDASAQAEHWVVYLNLPDPSDPRLTTWATRSYSIQQVAAQLTARGFAVDPSFVPLARRTTAKKHVVKTCWEWVFNRWVESPEDFDTGRCVGPPVSDVQEMSFT